MYWFNLQSKAYKMKNWVLLKKKKLKIKYHGFCLNR